MKTDISIEQFRSETKQFNCFSFIFSDARDPVRISAKFDRVCVNITGSPYVIFKNDLVEAWLRHIVSICKTTSNCICTYIFTCYDYTDILNPVLKNVVVECA